jgi:hypothetical protein
MSDTIKTNKTTKKEYNEIIELEENVEKYIMKQKNYSKTLSTISRRNSLNLIIFATTKMILSRN